MTKKHLGRCASLAVAMGLALLAFAGAAAMAWFVFERLPHLEDEVAYVFQARVMARGALWAPAPDNAAPFWVPFVLTVGERRFAKYPPGWPSCEQPQHPQPQDGRSASPSSRSSALATSGG